MLFFRTNKFELVIFFFSLHFYQFHDFYHCYCLSSLLLLVLLSSTLLWSTSFYDCYLVTIIFWFLFTCYYFYFHFFYIFFINIFIVTFEFTSNNVIRLFGSFLSQFFLFLSNFQILHFILCSQYQEFLFYLSDKNGNRAFTACFVLRLLHLYFHIRL